MTDSELILVAGALLAAATLPAVRVSIPPSTSIVPSPTSEASRRTLSGESAMNGWPPQPGLTVMQRKTSAS